MRILHLIQELGRGGAERMTAALVRGARRAGHDVAVVAAPGPLAAELDVPIFRVPLVRRRFWRLPTAVDAARRAARAWAPDLVHCHNPGMAVTMALAGVGRPRRRGLVTIEGLGEEDYRRAVRLLRWAGWPTVACGPGVADALREHGLRASIIANGVAPPARRARRAELEREWPAVRGRRVLIAAGRLVAEKNFALLIDMLTGIADAALVIVGDGPERPALARRAAALGVADRVVLPGFRTDVREIAGAAEVFVMASRREGLPLVALEALAAGRPLVAVRARWQHGVLTDGDDCVLAANDAPALAAAVRHVLDDSLLAAQLSANATRRAAAYTADAAVARYLRLYEVLVST